MKRFGFFAACLALAGFLAGYATAPRPATPAAPPPTPVRADSGTAVARPPEAEADSEAAVRSLAGNLHSAAQWENLLDALLAWSARDPQAALAFALENLKWRRQEQAIGAMLGKWTRRDPQAAWSWASANGSLQYIDAMLSELGKTDGTLAWQFATAYAAANPAAARATYVGALRGMTYAGDYEAAARRLAGDKVLDPEARTAVASLLIASEWGLNDPEKAVSWADGLAKDDPIRGRVLAELGTAWSAINPSAAAKFGLRLEAGEARREIMMHAVNNWIDREPASVGEFLGKVSPHPDFDQAMQRIATHPKVASDPGTALSWAELITDRELQTQTLTRIFSDWQQKDSATALAYLKDSLPAELSAEVLGRVRNKDLYSPGTD